MPAVSLAFRMLVSDLSRPDWSLASAARPRSMRIASSISSPLVRRGSLPAASRYMLTASPRARWGRDRRIGLGLRASSTCASGLGSKTPLALLRYAASGSALDIALSLPESFARCRLGLLCAGGREPRAMARSAL